MESHIWVVAHGWAMALTIRNARIPFAHGLWDIRVEGGFIVEVSEAGRRAAADEVLDVCGGLVSPPLVDAHLHLDKAYTFGVLEEDFHGGSEGIIPRLRELKQGFTEEDLLERGRRALAESLRHGVMAVRAFVDVDPTVGLKCLRAGLKLREEFREVLKVQLVAFPQEGLCGEPEKVELLWKAVELGADVVGGIPWYEKTSEEAERHIEVVFEVAKALDRDIHVVADDTDDPSSTNVLRVASKAVVEKWFGRVAASQCRGALDSPDDAYAQRVVALARSAGMSVVECPQTSLMLSGGRGGHPYKRGITRILEFAAAGVNVAAGQDDIQDPFYPFGRGSMVEVGFLLCHAARLRTEEGLRLAYEAITYNGARLMGLSDYGLAAGFRADLVVFGYPGVREVFAELADPVHVLKGGRLLVEPTR